MLAGAGIATTIGIFLVYLLGAILTWRQVALICGIVPAVNILVAVFVCSICRNKLSLSKSFDSNVSKRFQKHPFGFCPRSVQRKLRVH